MASVKKCPVCLIAERYLTPEITCRASGRFPVTCTSPCASAAVGTAQWQRHLQLVLLLSARHGTASPRIRGSSYHREMFHLSIYSNIMCFYGLLFLNCCRLAADFYGLKFILHQLYSLIPGGNTPVGNLGFLCHRKFYGGRCKPQWWVRMRNTLVFVPVASVRCTLVGDMIAHLQVL